MGQPTVPIYFVNEVLLNLEDQALRHKLLAKNHISPRLLDQPASRITAKDYANLIRDSMLAQKDEALGHGTATLPMGSWDMMCHYAIAARTLGEALDRYCRFYCLRDWGIHSQLKTSGDTVTVSLIANDKKAIRPYLFESSLFYAYRFSNWLLTQDVPLNAVFFHFPEPPHIKQHQEMFFCKNVQYDAAETSFSFNRNFLDYPVRQSLPALLKFLKHPNFELLIQHFNHRSWHSKVRSQFTQQMETGISFADLAKELSVHPQSLRRYLEAEGFQYKHIKEEVRRDTAISLLRDKSLSIEDIAFKVGFSESGTFIRSFRQWTGVTPYSYRKNR